MAEVRAVVELSSAVVVRPGHTLVVATARPATAEQTDLIRTRLVEQLPGVEIVVLPGVSQLLVYDGESQGGQADGRQRTHPEGP